MMSERRILLVISSVFLTPVLFTGLVILLAQVCGCVYSRTYIDQLTFENFKESSVYLRYPPATFSETENAWLWSVTVECLDWRCGVYKDPPKYEPQCGLGGLAGTILEVTCRQLIHALTRPAERIMSSSKRSIFDYALIDRNSCRSKIDLLEIPELPPHNGIPAFSLECQEFKTYQTNSVLCLDFARWEEFSRRGQRLLTQEESVEYCRLRDAIRDWSPVLWWRDSSGVENLIMFRSVYEGGRYVTLSDISHGKAQVYQLCHFKEARFVRSYDLEIRPQGMAEKDYSFDCIRHSDFLFDTIDGRHVNIASRSRAGSPCVDWMFRQIDLETGADRKVGSYSAMSKDCVDDGLELRVLGVRSRKGDY